LTFGDQRVAYKSSVDTFVVKIDEEGRRMVTLKYVTPGHNMVYNMNLSTYG